MCPIEDLSTSHLKPVKQIHPISNTPRKPWFFIGDETTYLGPSMPSNWVFHIRGMGLYYHGISTYCNHQYLVEDSFFDALNSHPKSGTNILPWCCHRHFCSRMHSLRFGSSLFDRLERFGSLSCSRNRKCIGISQEQ